MNMPASQHEFFNPPPPPSADDLILKVASELETLRENQRLYFKTNQKVFLSACLRLERKVDKYLALLQKHYTHQDYTANSFLLIRAASDMRIAQINYWKHRNQTNLITAKNFEKVADEALTEFLKPL